jgi:hypothetical protein
MMEGMLNKFFDNDSELKEKAIEKPMKFTAEGISKALKNK